MLSTRWQSELLKDKFHVEDSSIFKPSCALLCYPLTRSSRFEDDGTKQPEIPESLKPFAYLLNLMDTTMRKAFFGTETPTEEQLQALRTIYEVDESTPPTFLWTAADDYMVDAANSLDYAHQLLRHNVPVELHVFETGGYGLSKGSKDSASTPLKINEDSAQRLPLADRAHAVVKKGNG